MTIGGIETMLVNIINEQVKSNDVELLFINDKFEQALLNSLDARVKVSCMGRKIGSRNPIPLIRLNYKIMNSCFDVIHVHHPGIIQYVFRSIIKTPIVLTLHSLPSESETRYYCKYDKIYAISESVKQGLLRLGIESIVVYNGILTEKFDSKVRKGNDKFSIIQVGRLVHEYKGQDITINAISELVKMGVNNIHCDIYGDGPSYEYLKQLIDSLTLNNYVSLKGGVSPQFIEEHLCEYDLLVQPSKWEGFGLTIIEAMASGVSVLVSDIEAPMEVIEDGKYGYFFKTNDPLDMSNAIQRVLNQGGNIKTSLAKNRVETLFNVKNTAQSYLQRYKELL